MQSYSSRLSQWHLAIAALPDELCPPSVPSSPTSRARSEKLQDEIELAVRNGQNTSDFCKLRSTRLGYATMKPVISDSENLLEQEQNVPWILPETEEEWFEWERMMAERRSKLKGKDREILGSSDIQSQNALEKVISWKARLQSPSSSYATMHGGSSANIGRSQLGFPVVKRSSMFKEKKLKTLNPIFPGQKDTQRAIVERQSTLLDATGEQSAIQRPDTGKSSTVSAGDHVLVKGPNAECVLSEVLTNSKEIDALVTGSDEGRLAQLPDISVSFHSHQIKGAAILIIVQGLHPSFPSHLPTSTPKGSTEHSKGMFTFPPARTHSLGENTGGIEVIDSNLTSIGVAGKEQQSQPPSSRLLELEVVNHLPLHSTPPSPPNSSSNSPKLESLLRRPGMAMSAELVSSSATPPTKQIRPLTPPPEDGRQIPYTVPRTPELQPLKKYRAITPDNTIKLYNSAVVPDGPTTPQYSINGGGAIHELTFPRTPTQPVSGIDLLATSRRSKPRPRPPSRKQLALQMGLDGASAELSEDGGNPSPAKSDRSYFSSPASGESSGSSRGSTYHIPCVPTSPLAFTQSPARFAPLGESTQAASPKARLRFGGSSNSQTSCLPARRQQGLSREGTGLLGMTYDSQFDVDAQVNRLSNFLEQDVDLSAWVRDTDDEDEEEGAVEKLTYATSSVGI
ncbi:hypothetical protein EW145_g4884 [Phellinidium pouzarii]|uniref:Uncharacterized protein n=1 Tax=Phellinidium pouzarii TaxID=167371 RepID=A0A4S4L1X2_9AGAM|nr:hypothetical protein EW145_g4884 [Phellinidium pouzarii]